MDLLFSDRRQEYLCEDCGHRWSLPAPDPALDWPAGLSPGDLPTYLAAPLAALLAEPNPRVRLHWLVDCAEIAVRWSVAVTLAQVVQAHAGTLPERLVTRLREHIVFRRVQSQPHRQDVAAAPSTRPRPRARDPDSA